MYTTPTDFLGKTTNIFFLPNSSIDTVNTPKADLDHANLYIQPIHTALQSAYNQTFDFWELINWLYVSYYWTVLYDLGHISPYYTNTITSLNTTTNNIFVNETLFKIYSSYLESTIWPMVNFPNVVPFPVTLSDLSVNNSLKNERTVFIREYACVDRVLKQPVSLVISILVADYALIKSGYAVLIFIGAWLERRKHPSNCLSSSLRADCRGSLRWMHPP